MHSVTVIAKIGPYTVLRETVSNSFQTRRNNCYFNGFEVRKRVLYNWTKEEKVS